MAVLRRLVSAHDGNGLVDITVLEQGQRLQVQRWVLAPGVSEGMHTHGEDTIDDEVYYVLAGHVVVARDDEELPLAQGESPLVPAHLPRAGDEEAVVLVAVAIDPESGLRA